ncbi:MAG: Ig-like domain-containing protein [Prevotella sp.]|nr:Ig-like domain-containing protein [Prevotella sp.]
MGSPDGGWYDETPPRVVGASPADKATGVNTRKVKIQFNEFVKIENPTEKVVISPPQMEAPEIKSGGKSIEVTLKDTLMPNITYTIDFSDAITDNNEGNPLGNYTYSFSTGEVIDTFEVSGYVLDAKDLEPVKGILVGLYSNMADSAFRTQPMLRVSNTDSRGFFVIKGVAPGEYRAYALKDADGDYKYSQKSEMIAFNHDIIIPSSKPDTRQDTIWRDSLHIENILQVPYTHFLPDDIMLRAFTVPQTDRYLLKAERKEPDRFTFYFTYGNESLPEIRGLNFNERDAFFVDASAKGDTITYWLRDTALVNQDTLHMEVSYLQSDSVGMLFTKVDTLEVLAKVPYAKRLKLKNKDLEEWQKKQDKLKKKGEPYDSIMPVEPLKMTISAPGKLDPDRNILIRSPYPLQVVDTSKIHLYTKIDTLWYAARHVFKQTGNMEYTLMGEWRPLQQYSLEIDSAAFVDIFGHASKASKSGFAIKSNDEYSSILMTIQDMQGKHIVVELLDSKEKIVKTVSTTSGTAEFFYVNPGNYYMRMFVDRNANGEWDPGDFDADQQPEEVYYYFDAIECKAKWDLVLTWNATIRPLNTQKPAALVKAKAEKKKTVKSRNLERAKELGIKYVEKATGVKL